MINQQETASKTVYFSRSEMSPSALVNLEEDVHRICIAFKVNNRWNKKTFSLNYDGLQTDQRDKDSSSLLKLPFTPSFFPDVESLHLRGSIFDPVF